MNVQQTDKRTGFTIIEVVLVLAIAGLIFLMVFIALPALQRNQRDTQRRSDVARVNTQINNYQTNSRGNIPSETYFTDANGFVKKYLGGSASVAGSEYVDPSSGDGYKFTTGNTEPGEGEINYQVHMLCGDDGAATNANASTRNYVLRIHLEGQTSAYCVDNRS